MKWEIKFNPKVFLELSKLDRQVQKRILEFLMERLKLHEDPRQLGTALTGRMVGLWKYRIGDYGAVCRIKHKEITMLVLKLWHR
jgi:mRNA interferase RelE/StbE